MQILLNWLLSALALLVVAHIVPGFVLSGIAAALIAAVVIGFVNATLGLVGYEQYLDCRKSGARSSIRQKFTALDRRHLNKWRQGVFIIRWIFIRQ